MCRLTFVLSVLCIVLVSGENDLSDRIVNGRLASINEHRYQVSIQKNLQHFCGGSLITKNFVLTAAHCLVDIITKNEVDKLSIRAGSSKWKSGGVSKKAESVINHPKYDPKTMVFDVGLIKLMQSLIYSSSIAPVKLVSRPPRSGVPCKVSGWGKEDEHAKNIPENLMTVELSFLTQDDCASPAYLYRSQIKDSMVCAVGINKDSCQGDSGGPLVHKDQNKQIGIVSWGAGCAQQNFPGAYCDVANKLVRSFIVIYTGTNEMYEG